MLRFMVFSDMHCGLLFDAPTRIAALTQRMQAGGLDFAVSLGDLCLPAAANRWVVERLRGTGLPFYSLIGNHDIERSDEETLRRFLGLPQPYYARTFGEVRCLFLNTCYMLHGGRELPYQRALYKKETDIYPILPAHELAWLQQLADSSKRYVLFSHHSLINPFSNRGVQNREAVLALLKDIVNAIEIAPFISCKTLKREPYIKNAVYIVNRQDGIVWYVPRLGAGDFSCQASI